MKTRIRIQMTVVIFLAMTGCDGRLNNSDSPRALSAAMDRQCNQLYKKNASGERISWKKHVPIVFSIDRSFPAEFIPAINSAVRKWNKAAGFELFRIAPGLRADSIPQDDGQNTIYFLNNDDQGSSLRERLKPFFHEDGDLAVTIVSGRGNQIQDADILFDGVANTFSSSNLNPNSFDIEATALHELGHAIGLVHSADPSSIMYYGEAPGFIRRKIDATTIRMVGCEYQ